MKKHNSTLSGPYFEFSSPYGKVHHSLDRDVYYANVPERAGKIYKLVRYRSAKNRVIVDQTYPKIVFRSLKKALETLSRLEKPIVLCS